MRLFLASVLLIAGSVSAQVAAPPPLPQTGAADPPASTSNNIPLKRAADTYAIYSLLLPGQPFAAMPSSETTRWAIASHTINFQDMNPQIHPQGQLKAPSGDEKPFAEAVQDFEARRFERYTLQPKLQIGHAYDLLSPDQVDQLRSAKSSPDPGSSSQSQYSIYPGITFFSEVYFDSQQHAALVFMNNWCASLCSQGQWVYLEKKNGQWQRMSGITRPGA